MKGIGKKSISVLMTLIMLAGIFADLHWGFSAVEVFADEPIKGELILGECNILINESPYAPNNNTIDFSNEIPFQIEIHWKLPNSVTANTNESIQVELPSDFCFDEYEGDQIKYGYTNNRVVGHYTVSGNILTIKVNEQWTSDTIGINKLNGTFSNDILENLKNGENNLIHVLEKDFNIFIKNSTPQSRLDIEKYIIDYDTKNGYRYEVKITSHGTNSDIKLTDIVNGTKMDISNMTVTSSTNKVLPNTFDKTSNGFVYNSNYTMQDGEELYIKYLKLPTSNLGIRP